MTDQGSDQATAGSASWQPLSPRQRRVAGVLVEKAKTTPDAYPLTLNALTNGCNQKSNRSPQLNLSAEDVAEALEELRSMGAVAEVQSGGRVAKFRHLLYEWLGVDKVELAVMAELLLRGEQTLGELRARASRMEPIADLTALKPVVEQLMAKGLVVGLSPEGRGQVVTHTLHPPQEMADLRNRFGEHHVSAARGGGTAPARGAAVSGAAVSEADPAAVSAPATSPGSSGMVDQLRDEVAELREEVGRLRHEVAELVRSAKDG